MNLITSSRHLLLIRIIFYSTSVMFLLGCGAGTQQSSNGLAMRPAAGAANPVMAATDSDGAESTPDATDLSLSEVSSPDSSIDEVGGEMNEIAVTGPEGCIYPMVWVEGDA